VRGRVQGNVIEAAMLPMIGAGIVASQANLAPRLVSMMIGVGIPLGVLTAAAWHWLFRLLAA
jgi:predicted permease